MTREERRSRLLGHAEAYWRAQEGGDADGMLRHLWAVMGSLKERVEPSPRRGDVVDRQ